MFSSRSSENGGERLICYLLRHFKVWVAPEIPRTIEYIYICEITSSISLTTWKFWLNICMYYVLKVMLYCVYSYIILLKQVNYIKSCGDILINYFHMCSTVFDTIARTFRKNFILSCKTMKICKWVCWECQLVPLQYLS
jgi:hypothetical protein